MKKSRLLKVRKSIMFTDQQNRLIEAYCEDREVMFSAAVRELISGGLKRISKRMKKRIDDCWTP